MGRKHTGIVANNSLYMFGRSAVSSMDRFSYSGALGAGYKNAKLDEPTRITISDDSNLKIKDVACGFNYSALITEDGTLMTCGYSGSSQRTF
mmetsp:Transcript_58185/g.126471  ORF Transcript_58185/g.126471 Transcript_58185/m.126471 type:complete len:92 (+) Transcript_58185:237-512(+)